MDINAYKPSGRSRKGLLWAGAALASLVAADSCYFVVQPTERAGVRLLGKVVILAIIRCRKVTQRKCKKNDVIAKNNRISVSEFNAKQGLVEAQGEADAVRIRAQANRDATILQGEATAARYAAEIKGAGGIDAYVRIVSAQAQAKWDGRAPTYVAGEGGLAAAFLPQGERAPVAAR